MMIKVFELAEQIEIDTDYLLALCTLLEVPEALRINCLIAEQINKWEIISQ